MKSYRYKMYTKAKDGHLDNQIDRFGIVYNHCIALHRRYYKLTGKLLSKYQNPTVKDYRVQEWVCPHCGKVHDRDRNAAINIYREGMSSLRRGSVRPRSERSVA